MLTAMVVWARPGRTNLLENRLNKLERGLQLLAQQLLLSSFTRNRLLRQLVIALCFPQNLSRGDRPCPF